MKFGVLGVEVGFCLALLMVAFAYYANSHHLTYDLTLPYLYLAPTSIILMATERATPSAQAIIVLFFALSNALTYGLIFWIIGVISLVIGKVWARVHDKAV